MATVPDQHYFVTRTKKSLSNQIVNSVIKEVLQIARQELKRPSRDLTVLDVGCGTGEYAFAIEEHVKKIVGVEPYRQAFKQALAEKRRRHSRVLFHNTMIENFALPIKFDLAISLTTIEHMPDADASFARIFALLKPGGIVYVTAPNKLWPFENHYRLFFLTWLPIKLANRYVRIMNRAPSYEDSAYAKTYWGMRRLFGHFDWQYRFYLPEVSAPYLGLGEGGMLYRFAKQTGIRLIRKLPVFWALSKGFIIIAKKQYEPKSK